ncbi:unnamed protein product [Rotaria sp. Silwood2]|nr:unnamed protein product [Rotaria sp. Silwood2]
MIIVLSLLAGSLLLGDGALTPAVSVLSAVEGVAVEAPKLHNWIVPITVAILVLLFLAQRWGTSKIGVMFGPIMCLCIFKAFNPWEAFHYLMTEKKRGFYQIGGVFLSATGLEALYADLGHFGRWPIRCSWLFVAFPAVLFNYLGQGALLITDPALIDNPFYRAIPSWRHWPMVVLATIATIIASLAIITGSFSLISQAIGMECSVSLPIRHTSKTIVGQIYVPTINYILMFFSIAIVAGFQKGSNMTNAYGVIVCSVMVITTIVYMLILRYTWHKPWYTVAPFGIFLIIDLYTWSSNAIKIPSGGWVAILIACEFFILGFCWFFGQLQLRRFLKIHSRTTNLNILVIRLGLLIRSSRQSSQVSLTDIPMISTAKGTQSDNIPWSDSDSDVDCDTKDNGVIHRVQSRVQLIENIPIASSSTTSFYCDLNNMNTNNVIPAVVTPGVSCFLTISKKHTPHVF